MNEFTAIAGRRADEEIFEILHASPFSGRINCNRKRTDIGRSAGDDKILLAEQREDLVRANAQAEPSDRAPVQCK